MTLIMAVCGRNRKCQGVGLSDKLEFPVWRDGCRQCGQHPWMEIGAICCREIFDSFRCVESKLSAGLRADVWRRYSTVYGCGLLHHSGRRTMVAISFGQRLSIEVAGFRVNGDIAMCFGW